MIMQSHVLRDNAKNSGELILDNNDLERERGITILSKNVSVIYKDCKINIIDTRATPTSAARWSVCSTCATACCCSSMLSKERCPRPVSSSRKPSRSARNPSW